MALAARGRLFIPPAAGSRLNATRRRGSRGRLVLLPREVRQVATVRQLHVNGKSHAVSADAERSLLSVLRDDLDLTGCKYGCGEGRCGACTVLVDGQPLRSCTTAVGSVEDKPIRTIEGVADGDALHPVQQAFLDCGALQCGYCTPGMIMSAVALLERRPDPARADIVRGMQGNICRCGTYARIVAAIERAAKAAPGGRR
ncbi:MAG: (2Fe-2S)-binding protein [Planctomycetia bacterium]|nr:(2Fe-2S)-binding protein [Planctomycetia bacterium]